nr:MAG TPA: 27kDa outer membrane protein [Caudoviricetes sp.]
MSFSTFSPRSHLIIGHTLGHAYEPTPILDLWGGVCPKCPIFFQHIYIRVFAFFTLIYIHPIIHIFIFLFLYK